MQKIQKEINDKKIQKGIMHPSQQKQWHFYESKNIVSINPENKLSWNI